MVNAFRWMIFVIGLAVVIGSIMVTSVGGLRIEINSPSDDDTVSTDKITVYGRAIMDPSGAVVESVIVRVNDHPHPAYGSPSWHSELISLQPGQNKITAVAIDGSGKSATTPTIYVNYEPTPTPTNESTPVTPPTTTTISNGGYRPTPTPAPTPTGSISITTKPSEAEIFWDGVSKGYTPITFEDVVENHKIKISKEGYRGKDRNIYLYEGITKKLNNIKLNPITGFIVVSSTPSGACVYLDGDYNGKTPRCISTVVGNHTIELTKSDYFEVPKSVSVSDNNKTYLHVNLTGCGYINIYSYPSGANVYLDGNDSGETTPMNNYRVAVGNRTIKLTKLAYFDVITPVAVSLGGTYSVDENLTGYGSLRIKSVPSGASVYLDDIHNGGTPENISNVVEGSHSIRLTKDDYENVTVNISVSAGRTTQVSEPLSLTYWGRKKPWISVYAALIIVIGGAFFTVLFKVIPFVHSRLNEKRSKLNENEKEKDLLFSLDPSYRPHLKEGDVDEKLKKVFEDNKQHLSTEVNVSKIAEKLWKIVDGEMQYNIEDTEKRLNVYKKRKN